MAGPVRAFALKGLLRAALLGSTGLYWGVASPVVAQTTSEPESYRNIDEFGVDLSSGSFNFSMDQASGGSASTGIDVTRTWGRAGWKDAYAGHLRRDGSTITVVRGSTSEEFNLSSGTWVAVKANGATLVQTSGPRFPSFSYTGSDGTNIVYRSIGEEVFTPIDNYPDNYKIEGPQGTCRITQMQSSTLGHDLCAVPVSITHGSRRATACRAVADLGAVTIARNATDWSASRISPLIR